MPTKEELQAELDRIIAENQDLRETLQKRETVLSGSSEEGYLVEAPNQDYSGNTAGIAFSNGKAFVPAGAPRAAELVTILVDDFGYHLAGKIDGKTFKAQQYPQPEEKPVSTLEKIMHQPVTYGGGRP